MSNQGFKNVPGVPEGWELVGFRRLMLGDWYVGVLGKPERWQQLSASVNVYGVIRKIEKPKTYRPFANAEEFKPHRDRWWRYAVGGDYLPQINPPIPYNELGVDGATWQQAFNGRVFDDGTPFGVEVGGE